MTESTPVTPPVEPPAPAALQPRPPSRSAQWWSGALRWITGLLVVFALGLGATWLAQVRPLQQRVALLDGERASLQTSLAELQVLVAQMEDVRAENVGLKVAQAKLAQSTALLKARVGTAQAQLVLAAGGEAQQAVEALEDADGQLAFLEQALAGSQQESVRVLRDRLALAVQEVESDPFAARRDLEVLANGIETMEKALSGG